MIIRFQRQAPHVPVTSKTQFSIADFHPHSIYNNLTSSEHSTIFQSIPLSNSLKLQFHSPNTSDYNFHDFFIHRECYSITCKRQRKCFPIQFWFIFAEKTFSEKTARQTSQFWKFIDNSEESIKWLMLCLSRNDRALPVWKTIELCSTAWDKNDWVVWRDFLKKKR